MTVGLLRRCADTYDAAWRMVAPQPYEPRPAFSRADYLLALILAAIGVAVAAHGMARLSPLVYRYFDLFFQGDGPRIVSNMFDRLSIDQQRSNIHPIFAILAWGPANILKAMGFSRVEAAQGLILACAAATPALTLLSLRGLGLPRLAAAAFTGVLLASATFIHWFAFVETFAFSGVSIALMMFVLTSVSRGRSVVWVLSSALTLSFTITNFAFGVIATVCRLPPLRAAVYCVCALGLVAAIAMAQNLTFPKAQLFFNVPSLLEERQYTQMESGAEGEGAWTPMANLRAIVATSAVVPTATVWEGGEPGKRFKYANNQYSPLGSTPKAGLVALALWAALLLAGVWGAVIDISRRPVAIALVAYLGFQTAMHLVYGDLTFLYAADFFPAMVGLAAFSWFTPARKAAVVAALGFVVLAGYSNLDRFDAAAELIDGLAAQRLAAETAPAIAP